MISRIIAVVLAGAALTLRADEVAYSELEIKLPPPPAMSATMSPAQPVQLASHSAPLEYPTSEPIPAPAAEPAQFVDANESPMFVSADGCADCVGPEYWEFNPWYAGVDLVVFRASFSLGEQELGYTTGTIIDDDGFASLRPYVGWESPDGFGVRVRGWGYSQDHLFRGSQVGNPNAPYRVTATAASIDIDFYKKFRFSNSSITLGGGVKSNYLAFEYDHNLIDERSIAASGVSTLIEFRHVFTSNDRSEWAFVGRGRAGPAVGRLRGSIRRRGHFRGVSDDALTRSGDWL